MRVYNFDDLAESELLYGGHAGRKLGVRIDGENWFLKFPKSTRSFATEVGMSYSTSPLSEYIGSHVYESIGIPVHETLLGIRDGKLVVACKDFRSDAIKYRLDDYDSISNIYVEGLDEKLSELSSSRSHVVALDELMIVMQDNPVFKKCPRLKDRFWDMFVVDALIGNNDRNNGNWGILVHTQTKEIAIAPVFDNGASFNHNSSDEKIERILKDPQSFRMSAYDSRRCAFGLADRAINPFLYIEQMENADCNQAVRRVVPRICLSALFDMIREIPTEFDGVPIISDARKEFYCACLQYRYEKSLLPTYEHLTDGA